VTGTRRAQWLRIWMLPMGAFAAVAIGAVILVAVLGFPGWQWVEVIIGIMAVFTITLNMWMAWEATGAS
jgi:hypothetical protein